jgi:hypothetical protein
VLEKTGFTYAGIFAYHCPALLSWRNIGEPTTWFKLAGQCIRAAASFLRDHILPFIFINAG